jgi:diguanylate cyclase (GGDEF)-like protein
MRLFGSLRPPPPLAGRGYLLWMGPAAGLLVAWVWGDRSAVWLAAGVVAGYAAELSALRVGERESEPANAAVAFFLAFGTLVAAIPFLAVGGLLPIREAVLAEFRTHHLLVVPLAAMAATTIHHAYARRRAGDRDDRRRDEQPDPSRRWLAIFGGIALVLVIATADGLFPAPYSIDFLYLGPVLLVTMAAGPRGGILVALLSAESRGISRGLSYDGDLTPLYTAFDSLLVGAGLGAAALLLTHIHRGQEREAAAARTDILTGLMNRKAFLERLESEIARAGRHQRPLSVAYLDLDGFKAINDTLGHAVGDEVLRIVAGVLSTAIRGEDVAARLGGDEFAILLPETDPDIAPRVVERVRREIEDRMHAFSWQVTCSVGLVTTTLPDTSVDVLLHRADQLMYEVKNSGKNALRQVFLGQV